MKSPLLRTKTMLCLVLGLGFGFAAHAADTWTYGSVSNGAGVDTASSGAATLTTTGVYATNSVAGTNCGSGTCSTKSSGISGSWVTSTTANSLNDSPQLQFFSGGGLGMDSDGNVSPNHALDNAGNNTEGVLLQFSSSTILTGIDLGFTQSDSDISVFRYTGSTPPVMSCNGTINTSTGLTTAEVGTAAGGTGCVGASMSAMQSAGWSLIGNYGDLTSDNTQPFTYNSINSGNLGSSYWLITAYNSAYGTTAANGKTLDQGNDYFKLLSLAGSACTAGGATCGGTTTNKAPEPGSLALASLALFGVVYSRRQAQQRKS